ncbi:MAG: hypothetical protein LQ350_005747 [Teloschistes chrysophthalmus]|nr:MAG: hypothetical protein LQ350_005747 [Niorma chrysophthalma]
MGSASRSHRPEPLGFGNIGDGPRANDQQIGAGPRSAPAHVKSFGQFANHDGQQGSKQNLFEDHWSPHPGERYVTPTRRTLILTISSDKRSHSPDAIAMRHSATYSDLLQAQLSSNHFNETGSHGLGPLGVNSASYVHTTPSSSVSPGQNNNASSQRNGGRGYETLLEKYVAMPNDERPAMEELDKLMKFVLVLRRAGDTVPSAYHGSRDKLREDLYKHAFGTSNGSSRLFTNPSGLINVAGIVVTGQYLRDEILQFIEDQLDVMTPLHHDGRQFGAAGDVVGRQENHTGRASLEPPPSSGVLGHGQTSRLMSPVPEFQELNLEGPQPTMAGPSIRQPLTNSGMAPVHHLPLQQNVQFNPFAQGFIPGAQGLNPVHYGPTPMELQQQQYIAYLQLQQQQQQQQAQQSPLYPPNLVISRNGMVSGPNPLMGPAVTFVPGRPGMAQHGPVLPYGPQFFSGNTFPGPQYPGPMMPGNFMPNPQMLLGPFPHNFFPYGDGRLTRQSLLPPHMQHASNRTPSPANHRPRHVVPQRALLPYRPGSDDMYPVSGAGTSVQLQELGRHGPTSCIQALDPRNFPFVESAREAKVAEWGVMKLSNIPYSVTKQEVYGLLGRNAKIVTPELGVGIHIIMDRANGKTQECFVEFFSYGDALASFNRCIARGQNLRMGDRVVTVAMSSQDDLMHQMFPKAKNCIWRDGRPVITESEDPYNSGFKSFLTNEELLQMATHAEKPHRVSTPISSLYFRAFHTMHSLSRPSSVRIVAVVLLRVLSKGRDAFYLWKQQHCVPYTASPTN